MPMFASGRIPLARSILMHNRRRLGLSILGIALAVVIMFLEMGFFNGFNDSQTHLPRRLNADLVAIRPDKRNMMMGRPLDRALLYQSLAHPGVQEVVPVYEGNTMIENPQTETLHTVSVMAFPAESRPLALDGLGRLGSALKKQRAVLFDTLSRPILGDIRPGMTVRLKNIPYPVAGTVAFGANFSNNGYIFMSDTSWLSHPWTGPPDRISFGLIRARTGVDVQTLKAEISAMAKGRMTVLTPAELARRDRRFFTRATPVGILFGTGLALGFVIGVMICYQVLFNEVTDNIDQYNTMAAMGFTRFQIGGVIVRIALLLSVLGYGLGAAAGWAIYGAVERYACIPMLLTPARGTVIFLLTVFMCNLAGLMAANHLARTDPAEVF